MKADTTSTVEAVDTTSTPFRIQLKKLAVDNLTLIYDDRQAGMYAQIENFGATCSGDMASDRALLSLEAAIKALTFKMDGVPLLNKARLGAHLDIDADFANGHYTLKDGPPCLPISP